MLSATTRCLLALGLAGWALGPAQARTIDLEAYRFDPALGTPALPQDLTVSPQAYSDYGYFLVQTDQPITADWRDALEASGATVYGYVSEFAFLVGLDAGAQARVAALHGTRWMGPYQPAYKISPHIGHQVFVSPQRRQDPNLTLLVRVFRHSDEVAAAITSLGDRVVDKTDDGFSRRLVVSAPRGGIRDIARLPDVWWVEEKPEFRTSNNTTKWVVQSNIEGETPIWDHGIHGEGQIATLMDTGVDYNSCWFRDNNDAPPGPTNRKIIDYTPWGSGVPYDGCDLGHGSHVAGTLCGDQSFINPGNINYNGMAYKAKLTVQDIGADDWSACNLGTVGVPNSLTAALNASYALGARVHSDSWGSSNFAYDAYCVDVDNAMWNHQDFLVCFAAGNGGPADSSLGSPATAKDVISVGASEQAPYEETVADYSSRGPTPDGRIKPTLTAPGGNAPIYITSVDNDPGNPPAPTCQTQGNPFEGTSMATPAVSGSALLVRQYYTDGYYPVGRPGGPAWTPSAALIKATLIASTDDMGSPDVPNNNEGWGRIHLDNALYFDGDTRKLMMEDDYAGLRTGGSWSTSFNLNSNQEELVIALDWSDYPATTGTLAPLINDLDLVVTDPHGTRYLGNVFASGFSVPGGSPDHVNVEEGARFLEPMVGQWTVQVSGYNVPQAPQPFALVINGAIANWPVDPAGVDRVSGPAAPLVRVYPNPASNFASLHYAVPGTYSGPVQLEILDVQGRVVRSLVEKGQNPGEYGVTWHTEDDQGRLVPNGVYFARLAAGSHTARTKIVVQR